MDNTAPRNDKIYIHEFVDIVGHNRANYMQHITANWSPIAQDERQQLCYGVWGVVGTTGQWPAVVNIWEEDGFDGMATSFRHEFSHATLQDPKLAKWWGNGANFRSGGHDRLLLPAPWSPTIEALCHDGVRGETYAHERLTTAPGNAHDLLERIGHDGSPLLAEFGWVLAGAWETAMVGDSEVIALWAIPSWEQWAAAERAERADTKLARWRSELHARTTAVRRILLVDAPLSPFRTGRQPRRDDRVDWVEL